MQPRHLLSEHHRGLAGTCHLCGVSLSAGETAVYDRIAKSVRCLSCPKVTADEPSPFVSNLADLKATSQGIEAGIPGASARREYDRRKARREARIRETHPKLGGLILALSSEPQSTRAWERGAVGEEMLAERLKDLPESTRVLNDRRIPGTRANIDHIVIAPSGVWIVDAKRYKGKRPELRVEGGIIRQRMESLRIGGRDGTRLVDGVEKQVTLVKAALENPEIPAVGVLCFLEADWPIFGGGFTVDDVHVLWPRLVVKRISAATEQAISVSDVHSRLAAHFPVA